MTNALRSFAVAAVLALGATHARAQDTSALNPGARVRVTWASAGSSATGTLLLAASDSLVVRFDAASHPLAVRTADVKLLELNLSPGSVRRQVFWSALTGGAVGGSFGLGFAVAAGASCVTTDGVAGPCGPNKPEMAIVFGIVGSGIGAIIGMMTAKEHWVAVRMIPAP